MDTKEVLKELGLSEGEATVYLALLKLGETAVSELTKETGQHRTTIYDFLEHLIQRGLVSYVVKSGIKYYKVADPDKLIDYLKEKEAKLKQVLPDLKELAKTFRGEIHVEVYKGLEGFKSVLNDRIKTGGDMHAFGVDEAKFKEKFATLMDQFFRRERENKLKEYIITSEKAKFTYKHDHIQYKCISDKYFEPTATAIYKDRVFILIWEPFTTILIKNLGLAESYRRHHKLLWKLANNFYP